jgi:GNAT superfamily N-acetyltransferase
MSPRIEALRKGHQADLFSCEKEALNQYIRQTAGQHTRKGVSRTFVLVDENSPTRVLGYYTLAVGQTSGDELPAEIAKKLPAHIPIALVGRLARDESGRGQGLGSVLVVDTIRRIVLTAEQIGIALILVDAKDAKAATFYQRYGFRPLPDQPLRLVITMATARQAILD